MFDDVPVIAAVIAAVAALIHCYIFVMESVLWTTPKVRATFGVASAQEAQTTRQLAFNQGWYNLFLAIGTALGIALAASGDDATRGAGVGIMLLATGSMVGAALVLVISNPRMARAAAVQGLAPAVAIVLTLVMA